MTKNRARKQAARERAALTGERYVVAQRAVASPPADPEPARSSRAHEFMHAVPGVPAHVEGGLQTAAPRRHNSPVKLRRNPQRGEPRVLVAWQNWIARRVGAGSR